MGTTARPTETRVNTNRYSATRLFKVTVKAFNSMGGTIDEVTTVDGVTTEDGAISGPTKQLAINKSKVPRSSGEVAALYFEKLESGSY
jgi:hypothetical protein